MNQNSELNKLTEIKCHKSNKKAELLDEQMQSGKNSIKRKTFFNQEKIDLNNAFNYGSDYSDDESRESHAKKIKHDLNLNQSCKF